MMNSEDKLRISGEELKLFIILNDIQELFFNSKIDHAPTLQNIMLAAITKAGYNTEFSKANMAEINFIFNVINEFKAKPGFNPPFFFRNFITKTKLDNKFTPDDWLESYKFFVRFFDYTKSIIKEMIEKYITTSEEESNKHGPLGKYAFPNSRVDKRLPYEQDTRLEKELYLSILRHIINSDYKITKDIFDKLVNIIQLEKYSDIFNFYESGPIYRGMIVNQKYVEQLEKFDELLFKPHLGTYVSSWSKSIKQAQHFSKGSKGSYSIVLSAHPTSNDTKKWIDANGFYDISIEANNYKKEQEVIVGGNVKVEIEDYFENN